MAKKSTKKSSSKKTTKSTKKKSSSTSAPAAYKSTQVAPTYKSTAVKPADYVAGVYNSKYDDRINKALDQVTNWKYDPLQDASYQALARVYAAQGNIAAKNSLGDAAALNGGMSTSYAVSAAQQARNQANQELASMIPGLESAAYQKATGTLSALREADDTAYGRFRDTESDRQWKYSKDYDAYRDQVADDQWKFSQEYQAYRDKEADAQWAWTGKYNAYRDAVSDQQWTKEYELKKSSSGGGGGGGGGGGRRSSGGSYTGGSTTGYTTGSGNGDSYVLKTIRQDQERGKKLTEKYKKTTKKGNGGR